MKTGQMETISWLKMQKNKYLKTVSRNKLFLNFTCIIPKSRASNFGIENKNDIQGIVHNFDKIFSAKPVIPNTCEIIYFRNIAHALPLLCDWKLRPWQSGESWWRWGLNEADIMRIGREQSPEMQGSWTFQHNEVLKLSQNNENQPAQMFYFLISEWKQLRCSL